MISNSNPIFSKENIKKLGSFVDGMAFSLCYDAVETSENKEAGEKLLVIKYFIAFIGDHIFGYYPASYFLNDEQRQPYSDFVDDLKSDPERVVELLAALTDGFEQIDFFEFPEGIWGVKPKRNEEMEEEVIGFIREIYQNMDDFISKVKAAPQNQDSTKPTEAKIRSVIEAISEIQRYMVEQGNAHGQIAQAVQFSNTLEVFKNPLLFLWEQLHYGWHSDFWKEGDSMLNYDIFLFNAEDVIQNCLQILGSASPFTHFEREGKLTAELTSLLSYTRDKLSKGEFIIC